MVTRYCPFAGTWVSFVVVSVPTTWGAKSALRLTRAPTAGVVPSLWVTEPEIWTGCGSLKLKSHPEASPDTDSDGSSTTAKGRPLESCGTTVRRAGPVLVLRV